MTKSDTSFWRNSLLPQGLGILSLVVLFIFLRWNNFNAPLIRDEGEYAYSARLLIQGVAPYDHAFIQKPPMVVYSYALSSLFLPQFFWSCRLLAALFVALATVLLGYAGRIEFGKGVALPAMWLMSIMVLLPGLDQFTANTEMFMLLPLLATVAIYVCGRRQEIQSRYWLAAGFFAVTTLLYKYTALPVLAFIFIYWSVEVWRGRRDVNAPWRCWLGALLGGAVAGGLELGYFLIHDGGAHLWECTVVFNRYYAATNNFNPAYFGTWLETFFKAWWILFVIPLAILLRPLPRVGFWAGLLGCALFSTNASGYGQYYVVAMPFWAMLAALGARGLALQVSRRVPGAKILIMLVVVLLLLKPDEPWLLCSPQRFVSLKMDGFPFEGAILTAKHVAELSSPDDFVYVAGSEPEILYYADRFSPTRFITSYAMMIPTVLAQRYQDEAIRDLSLHPPKLIVYTRVSNSWLRQTATPSDFTNFLQQLLQMDYTPVGMHVPGGPNGGWVESPTAADASQADLVLFKRRETD